MRREPGGVLGEICRLVPLTYQASRIYGYTTPSDPKAPIFVLALNGLQGGRKVAGVEHKPPAPPKGGEQRKIPSSGGLGGPFNPTNAILFR